MGFEPRALAHVGMYIWSVQQRSVHSSHGEAGTGVRRPSIEALDTAINTCFQLKSAEPISVCKINRESEDILQQIKKQNLPVLPEGEWVLGLMKMPFQGRNSHLLLWQSDFILFMSNSKIPWRAAHHASLSFTIAWSLLKLISIELVMPSSHLILCYLFLLLSSIFPNIRCLPWHLLQWQSEACSQNSISAATCSLSPDQMGDLIFLKEWPPRGTVQLDYSPSDSSFHRIFQARILEWFAISFSRGSSWPRDQTWVSCIAGRSFYYLSHQGAHKEAKLWQIKDMQHHRLSAALSHSTSLNRRVELSQLMLKYTQNFY